MTRDKLSTMFNELCAKEFEDSIDAQVALVRFMDLTLTTGNRAQFKGKVEGNRIVALVVPA